MARVEAAEPIWLCEGVSKRDAVQRMFSDIAPTYDLLNSLLSFRRHKRWRAIAANTLRLKPGDAALDVCCGTGDFMKSLKKLVGKRGLVIGVDFSEAMLERAKKKGDGIVVLGDACRLPVASGAFDAVSVGWGIRNVPDIDAVLRELVRAIKPGGRFVSIDMARPKGKVVGAFSAWAFTQLTPLFGAVFGKREAYTYLPKSTGRFLSREALADSMRGAGLADVAFRDFMLGNVCMHTARKL